jgi:stage III sporulation protein AF
MLWAWLRNIVLLLLFILGVDLLLPRSAFRRYLRLVSGMILVLVVLEPVLAWVGVGVAVPGLSPLGPSAGAWPDGTLPPSTVRQVQCTVERQVEEAFRQRVASSVRDLLLDSGAVSLARVEVTLAGAEVAAVRVRVRPRAGHLSAGERERLGDLVARYLGIPRERVAVEEG